jgi:hypothetical protein
MASVVTSAPHQFQPIKQERNGRDFVGHVVDGLLTEDNALTGCPGGDQMQRLATVAARMGSPRGLTVDGDDVRRVIAQRLDPVVEAGLEQLSIEPVDYVVERVVGRQATFVGQETPQEIEPLVAPQPDFHEILHTRQFGAKHQQQYFRQRIHNPPMLARV